MRNLVTIEEAKKAPVTFWLMACYAYEELDEGIMTDAVFDQLVAHLDDELMFSTHPHAHLLDPTFLRSSVGATKPRHEWPLIVFGATHQLMDEIYGVGLWGDVGQSYKERLRRLR